MIRVPRPEVLSQIPRPHAVLEASAGTGKTYTLEHLVVDRVLEGVPLEQILVVTYTDKAALELRTRIRALLDRFLGLSCSPEPLGSGAHWTLDEAALASLAKARMALERASISTIHSFCQRILAESALERRSLFDQEQGDARRLFDRAWGELLREGGGDPAFLDLLREALALGWSAEDLGGLLWEAHKERARFRPEGAAVAAQLRAFPSPDPDAVMAIWTAAKVNGNRRNAALRQLRALLAALAAGQGPLVLATTLADLELKSLRDASTTEGLAGPARELADWLGTFTPPTPEGVLVEGFLPPVQARLRALKDAEGRFDFDDMILRVREALEGPGGEPLAARIRERYRVALIDEFQDTDADQWEIFRHLFHREDRELVLVGDPKQAIYGFRGGDLPTYLEARRQLTGGHATDLATNFRSTPPMLEACATLFSSEDYFSGEIGFHPVACGKPELGFEDALGAPIAPLRVLPVEGLDGGLRLWRRVALGLASELKALVDAKPRFGTGAEKRTLGWQDAFVLVGKASEGRLMAEALGSLGVPFAFYKQKGLFQSPQAEAWLSLLRALEDPRHRGRQARAFLGPFFGLGLADLAGLGEAPEDHPALQRLGAWAESARHRRFGELVEGIFRESAVAERLLLLQDSERALVNLRHLGELLVCEAEDSHGDLGHLVRQLKRWQEGLEAPPGEGGDEQRLEGREDAVQILTLHASKGLEAPVVALFAPGERQQRSLRRYHEGDGTRCLHLGAPPKGSDAEARIRAEEDQEDERLMYVALTRAKAHLLVPCFFADSYKNGSERHTKGPHRVLNRVLKPLVEEGHPWLSLAPGLAAGEALPEPPRGDLGTWAPAPSALHPPWLDAEALRQAARPRRTTSFTALQRRLEDLRPSEPGAEAEDPEPDAPLLTLPPERRGADLPGGRAVGTLLHELLEEADPALVRGLEFDTWWRLPGLRERLAERAALAGLGPEQIREVGRHVYLALHTPLPLAGGEGPLCEADHLLRELDFLSGFPGSDHFLGGSLDALFEKGGRTYLLDWKSNRLGDYGPDSLAACVGDHYELQVRIYTLAALRFLGIREEAAFEARFGGVLYVFLRGLPGGGIWFTRPSWGEVQAWEAELARLGAEVLGG